MGIADGCAVASHVDGVHDSERAAHAKDEAEEESEDGRPEKSHDGVSLTERRVYLALFDDAACPRKGSVCVSSRCGLLPWCGA